MDYTFTNVTNNYEIRATFKADPIARLTSHSNGATLNFASAVFTWNDVGASEYRIYVGSTQGAYNLKNLSAGNNHTQIVTNLPSDGSNIWLRLLSKVDGSWHYNDYQFTTGTNPINDICASLTSHTNGESLDSNSVTFTWTDRGARTNTNAISAISLVNFPSPSPLLQKACVYIVCYRRLAGLSPVGEPLLIRREPDDLIQTHGGTVFDHQ